MLPLDRDVLCFNLDFLDRHLPRENSAEKVEEGDISKVRPYFAFGYMVILDV